MHQQVAGSGVELRITSGLVARQAMRTAMQWLTTVPQGQAFKGLTWSDDGTNPVKTAYDIESVWATWICKLHAAIHSVVSILIA